MKFRFRTTQLTLFLAVLLPVVTALGLAGYWAVRFTGQDLGHQLLQQTSFRVDEEIERVLNEAVEEVRLTRSLIESGTHAGDRSGALVPFWSQVLGVRDELTGLFLAREADGSCVGVSRLNDSLGVWQLDVDEGGQRLREFEIDRFPDTPYRVEENAPYDIRRRPWYLLAKNLNGPAWADCYPFLGLKGNENEMGVTYAEPIRDADGRLTGVVSADFSVRQLSGFLKTLRVGQSGYAFVVELRDDGSRAVIAHPDYARLTRRSAAGVPSLIPVEESPDRLVVHAMREAGPGAGSPGLGTSLRFEEEGVRHIGLARRIKGAGFPPWQVVIILPEEDIFAHVDEITAISAILAIGSVAIVVLFGVYLSTQIARPLEQLAAETEAVGRFDLAARPLPQSVVLEVDRLSNATGDMKTSLRSFQKFVPADVVRSLVASRQEASFGGERRCVTTLFSDIVSFTSVAEGMSPEELVGHLREYLSVVSDAVACEEGTVDKFIGDAVMAIWGAPVAMENHALAACRAALAVEAALAEHRPAWRQRGLPEFRARYGINTGDVVVGNIGSDTRLSYTAIGDAVNLASRLEGLNKEYGTTILLSESTRTMAGNHIIARPLDWVSVKGKSVATPIYELLGLSNAPPHNAIELAGEFESVLDLYRARQFEAAIQRGGELLKHHPGDAPTLRLQSRCEELLKHPPAADWDGTFHALTK